MLKLSLTAVLLFGALQTGCDTESPFSGGRWIDLSHGFDDSTIYWPTATAFSLDTVAAGMTDGGYYYAANDFRAAEHGGTHLDAPIHFAAARWTSDEIPIERLIGPGVVVRPSADAAPGPDYQMMTADFEAWEQRNGPVPEGAIVLLDFDHARHWPDRMAYLGTRKKGPEAVPELHFPGLHPEAARWLQQNRRIAAIGLDTPSIDYGQSADFMSHRILFESNIPAFENVAGLRELPEAGSFIVALPMKITGGSGGPLRIVAWVPN